MSMYVTEKIKKLIFYLPKTSVEEFPFVQIEISIVQLEILNNLSETLEEFKNNLILINSNLVNHILEKGN